jgi:hypothetical protein
MGNRGIMLAHQRSDSRSSGKSSCSAISGEVNVMRMHEEAKMKGGNEIDKNEKDRGQGFRLQYQVRSQSWKKL